MISKAARHNLAAHIRGERALDLDALLAPLCENPSYVVPGYVLHGRAAVAEMYRQVMPALSGELSDEYLRALDDPAVARWDDDHCVPEYSDAYSLHRGVVVVVRFEGDLLRSENTCFTSRRCFEAAKHASFLGDIAGAIPINEH